MKSALVAARNWLDDRTGVVSAISSAMRHVVPRDAKWWYVLGSAALACFMMQIVTGISLALFYIPGAGDAYNSLVYITNDAFLGKFVRGLHFYGSSAMIGLVILHMTQVYLHAAYKYPREVHWMSGVLLFVFTIGMGFTGQTLRWDANAVWSIVVGVEQAARVPFVGEALAQSVLGGENPGAQTLSRFFVLHVFVLPGGLILLLVAHLALVLRNGISEMPKVDEPVEPETYREEYHARLKKTGVPFWPFAAWRDAVFSLLVVSGIFLSAAWLGPPTLDAPPDPADVNVDPAPDWYLRWYFAVLSLSPHSMETYIILLAPPLAILALFLLPVFSNRGHRAISKRPWALAIVAVAGISLTVLTVYGYTEPWSPRFDATPLPMDLVKSEDPKVLEGAELFNTHGCLFCHMIEGHGGKRGPDLSDVGDRLTHAEMIIRINHGGYNMPAFASRLDTQQLEALAAFLETRKQ